MTSAAPLTSGAGRGTTSTALGTHGVWSQLFTDVSPPRVRDIQLREKCNEVIKVLRHRAAAREVQLVERDWQIESSACLLLGNDVSVVAATSDGKCFCYQLLAMVALGRCVLVVSPLVALIADQVSMEALQISERIKTLKLLLFRLKQTKSLELPPAG